MFNINLTCGSVWFCWTELLEEAENVWPCLELGLNANSCQQPNAAGTKEAEVGCGQGRLGAGSWKIWPRGPREGRVDTAVGGVGLGFPLVFTDLASRYHCLIERGPMDRS